MRLLILGGAGMLGHKLCQQYRERFETWVTLRSDFRQCARFAIFEEQRTLTGVDCFDFDTIVRAVAKAQPDVVINCIGIIKQRPSAHDPLISITVNALFPHRLANLCRAVGARLIHISTDCVFAGRKGMYREDDVSDAEDLYGRTKFLGEVSGPDCLTLRTSIIGRELASANGLVEWFLSQCEGPVRGFTRAIYSGFSTLALARIIADVLVQQPDLSGLYHVSAEPISKYDLLCLLRDAFGRATAIESYADVQTDRSLDSGRFRTLVGFAPPTWAAMIAEMAADSTPYDPWRRSHVT